jgi:hypothetical protein
MMSRPTLTTGVLGSLLDPNRGERFMSGFMFTPSDGGVVGPVLDGEDVGARLPESA